MSHDRGWRAACRMTIWVLEFHFEIHEVARGVTAMVVGSGALLGRFLVWNGIMDWESRLKRMVSFCAVKLPRMLRPKCDSNPFSDSAACCTIMSGSRKLDQVEG